MTTVAQGQLTLTDLNDAKQLILYLSPNYKSQVYDPSVASSNYNPDFTTANLVITPQLYIAGNGTNLLPSTQVQSVTWYEGSQTTTPLADATTGTTPAGYSYAIAAGAANTVAKTLTIKSNLTAGNTIIYTCVVVYQDPATGLNVSCQALVDINKITSGSAAITVVLTNSSATVPTDEAGANGIYTTTPTDVHVYEGTTELNYDGVGTANGTYKITLTPTGITAGTITDQGVYATVNAASAITTDAASITIGITGKRANGTAISINQTQTITRAKTGVAPTAYWMVLDTAGIKQAASGAYTPASYNITGKSQKGVAAVANYTSRIKIEYTVDNSTWTTSANALYNASADTSSYPLNVPLTDAPANVKQIRISMYVAGGTTTLLDQQVIPVVLDGTQSITALLTNDSATVPTDENGANGIYTATTTDIHVYDGVTELTYDGTGTANGTYKVVTAVSGITAGTVSVKTGTPNCATMAAASAISADAATITFTITGKSNSGGAINVTKVMAISRAKTGVAPTAYWLVTDSSTIQKNYLGAYNPTSYNLTGKSQKGANAIANYTARIKVEYTTDGTTYNVSSNALYNASADTSTYPLNVPLTDAPANLKAIRVSMYQAGGTTVLLDQEIINVVVDGADSFLVRVSAPNGATIRNGGSDVVIRADMYKGAGAVTPTAFKWYNQDPTATTASGGDTDGGNGWRLINGIVAPTTAPTLALSADANTHLTATTYYVKYTWCGLSGETVGSPEASLAVTAGNDLKVTIPAFPTYVTQANVYIGTATGVEYYAGVITASAGSLTINKYSTANTPIPTVDTAGSAIVTSAQITVKAWAINGVEGFKCVATAPATGSKYSDIIICTDFTDPIVANIVGQNVFKNGQGSLTLQAQLLQAGVVISNAGYTFAWALYDNTGTLIKTYSATTDTITVPATDVAATANLVVTVSQ